MKREQLPQFCKKCANVRRTFLSGALVCRANCKYNPACRYSASLSFYHKASGVGAA